MNVLVTGFDGFVGSHLIEKLKGKYEVFGITHYSVGKKIKADFPYAFVDISDNFQVKNILRQVKPDIIVNLAAQSSVSRSFDRPEEYMESNLIGVINLAENAMREIPNFKKFIQASTPEVYGRKDKYPISEEDFPNPTTPYAVSKFSADMYLKYMNQAYDFPVVMSRHANSYGRKAGIFNHLGVIENTITQMLKGNEVNLGNGDVSRDFIYIDDVCDFYETLIEKGESGEIYNMGWGKAWKISDMADLCAEVTGFKGVINYNTLPSRPGEMKIIELDASKAKKELGFSPKIELKEGLEKVRDYWKGNL